MTEKKSDLKEIALMWLLILTFAIPVIPLGLMWAYNTLAKSTATSSTSSSSISDSSLYSNDSEDQIDETPIFGGYECTSDCSGHEAGYDWAEENDICNTEFDGGNSESFAEGVRAYAEDNCSSYDNEEDYYEDDYYW